MDVNPYESPRSIEEYESGSWSTWPDASEWEDILRVVRVTVFSFLWPVTLIMYLIVLCDRDLVRSSPKYPGELLIISLVGLLCQAVFCTVVGLTFYLCEVWSLL